MQKKGRWIEADIGGKWVQEILLDEVKNGIIVVESTYLQKYLNGEFYKSLFLKYNDYMDYRGFRELETPAYIPFTQEDYKLFMNRMVRRASSDSHFVTVTKCGVDGVWIDGVGYTYSSALSVFTFLDDGSPFGKEAQNGSSI